MGETIRRSRTETYEITIAGLLTKRADLFNEAEGIKSRLAEIYNDVAALDRSLNTLGYTGELDSVMPRRRPTSILGSGEAAAQVMAVLRQATSQLSSRQVARILMENCGQDPTDKKALGDRTDKVSRVLRRLRDRNLAACYPDPEGPMVWERLKRSNA